ncbi:uncharacterized protein LOC126161702 isoform X5 [Schistocerca cancellata]|uniref:uncharacterized protein LOC126161702 isoform X3 n=1 Tax=Schistocerca cancellata TaxID=274614 RepID=UPI002118DE44|nr:uncharacterized protein LOC126161702 isoform X3 [Schistocerca cancellata]XP_049773683.1 uncharacterized protein LOC126161702 isoform X5 [Schistocerca cancellata]
MYTSSGIMLTALHAAVGAGNLEDVMEMLAKGADAEAADAFKVTTFTRMRTSVYVAVLALLLGSVTTADEHDRSHLVEKLLRLGSGQLAAKLLPGLKLTHVGDVRPISGDDVEVSRLSFSLDSTTQDVDGVLSDLTISGISSLKVKSTGRTIEVSGDITMEGNYEVAGTVREGRLDGAGAISINAPGFQASATADTTPIDDTTANVNSVQLSVSAPSVTITYENLVLDTSGVEEFLKDLLEH